MNRRELLKKAVVAPLVGTTFALAQEGGVEASSGTQFELRAKSKYLMRVNIPAHATPEIMMRLTDRLKDVQDRLRIQGLDVTVVAGDFDLFDIGCSESQS